MKANIYLVIISLLGLLSCASNKSVTQQSETQGITAEMEDKPDTNAPEATSSDPQTGEMNKEEADTTFDLDQDELERQRITAEKEAMAERARLEALRQEISRSDAEADSIIGTSQLPPNQELEIHDREHKTMDQKEPQEANIKLENTTSPAVDLEAEEIISNGITSEVNTAPDDFYSEGNVVIQFFASASGLKDFDDLSKFGKIIIENVPGRSLYRYNLGYYRNRVEAEIVLSELKGEGWSDAFVKEVER